MGTFYGSGLGTSSLGGLWHPGCGSPRKLLPLEMVVTSIPGHTQGSGRWSSFPRNCLAVNPDTVSSKLPGLLWDGSLRAAE